MRKFLLICFLLTTASVASKGQAFVYRPTNPAFGGNYLNYGWMLSSATAQDTYKDPKAATSTSSRTSQTSLEQFSDNLQRQILNRLSRDLVGDQFGEDDLKEGTYTFGDFQVTIKNEYDGVNIRIVDGKGGETAVTVPYY